MNYEKARYVTLMLYAPNRNSQALNAFEDILAWLANAAPHVPLRQKGFAYFEGLNIKTLRKRQFKSCNSFEAWGSDISKADEVGIYVYDDEWSEVIPPRILANIHISNTGEIVRFKLRCDQIEADRICFAMIAIRSDLQHEIREDIFERLRLFIDQAKAIRGKILHRTSYFIERESSPYGKTALEWAYRNVTQELPEGDIARWGLPADEDLIR